MAKAGRCEYSGQETKGGSFVPGYDAKLKSALFDAADLGDVDAGAEAVIRNWASAERFPKIRDEVVEIAAKDNTGEWLAGRVQDRWASIEGGAEPRYAVSRLLAEDDLAKQAAKQQAAAAKAAKAAEKAQATADAEGDSDDDDDADDDDDSEDDDDVEAEYEGANA